MSPDVPQRHESQDGPAAGETVSSGVHRLVGSRLGEYEIVRLIGHGSMGVVFEARHLQLGRTVALKVLPPGLGTTTKAIHRFLREARAVAQLSHEHIVPIYDIGESGSTHFYAMQLLEGQSLDRVLKADGPFAPYEAAQIVATAARAVHFAHTKGIIHRDIKPANIIRTDEGRIVLTDFGLARPEQAASITDSGAMVGTPLYMSPEQVQGNRGEVDRLTDVYSLGATLYELLTGKPPFHGESTQEILQKIMEQDPASTRTIRKGLPAELDTITLKALEKKPQKRYASAQELAGDLERFLEGEPILARRASTASRIVRRIRKHRTVSILSTMVAAATLTVAAIISITAAQQRDSFFANTMQDAQSSYRRMAYESAAKDYEEALDQRADDPDALLGHARTLLWWGSTLRKRGRTANDPELVAQAILLFPKAATEVALVLEQRPGDPLAEVCKAFLLLQTPWDTVEESTQLLRMAKEYLDRADAECENRGPLLAAETRHEIALGLLDFSASLLEEAGVASAADASQLLQTALTRATSAVNLFERALGTNDPSVPVQPENLARLVMTRARIYQNLFRCSVMQTSTGEERGNIQYLVLCEADAAKASALYGYVGNPGQGLLDLLEETRGDLTTRNTAPPDPDAPPVLRYLTGTRSSDRSRALEDMLDNMVQNGLFVQAYGGDLVGVLLGGDAVEVVTEAARRSADLAHEQAQRLLADVPEDPELARPILEEVHRLLDDATRQNPGIADYHFEKALVCESLDNLAEAITHSQKAVDLAPSNPVILEGHTRRLLKLAALAETQAEWQQAVERALGHSKELLRLYGREQFEGLLQAVEELNRKGFGPPGS